MATLDGSEAALFTSQGEGVMSSRNTTNDPSPVGFTAWLLTCADHTKIAAAVAADPTWPGDAPLDVLFAHLRARGEEEEELAWSLLNGWRAWCEPTNNLPPIEEYILAHRCPTCRVPPGELCVIRRRPYPKIPFHVARYDAGWDHHTRDVIKAPGIEDREPNRRYDTTAEEYQKAGRS